MCNHTGIQNGFNSVENTIYFNMLGSFKLFFHLVFISLYFSYSILLDKWQNMTSSPTGRARPTGSAADNTIVTADKTDSVWHSRYNARNTFTQLAESAGVWCILKLDCCSVYELYISRSMPPQHGWGFYPGPDPLSMCRVYSNAALPGNVWSCVVSCPRIVG